MKKRLLISFIVGLVLACIFALGVSAAAWDEGRTSVQYTDFDGVTHNVPIYKSGDTPEKVASVLGNYANMQALCAADENAFVVLADSKGGLTAFPTYYVVEPKDQNVKYVAISEIEYTYVNTLIEGKTYSKGAVRYIEFPHGMTEVRANSVFGGSAAAYETNVTEIHIPNTVTAIGSGAFDNQTKNAKLKYVYIEAGNTISKIGGSTFAACSNLEYIQFENLTEITSLDGISNCNFKGTIDLRGCTKLKTLGGNAFSNSENLEVVYLPDNLEVISELVFSGCTNVRLGSDYLPSSLKSIGYQFLFKCKNVNSTFVFPAGFENLGNEFMQDAVVGSGTPGVKGAELNLVFLGKVTGVVYLNGNGHQKHADKVTVYFAQNSLSDYNKNGFYIKPSGSSTTSVPGAIRAVFCAGTGAGTNGQVTGIEYVYITNTSGTSWTADMVNDQTNGFDFDNHTHYGVQNVTDATCGQNGVRGVNCIVCDRTIGEVIPATGDHCAIDDKNCETDDYCAVCGNLVTAAITHVLGESYEYPNGFMVVGIYKNGCTNEGCEHGTQKEIEPLATSKGYSQDSTSNAVVLGFTVNHEAISAYETYLGTKISYGLVASNEQDDNKPLNEDGSAKAGAVKADFTSLSSYSILQLKITNVDDKDKYFHCVGYFIIGNEITYVNGEETASEAIKVSYNNYTGKIEK